LRAVSGLIRPKAGTIEFDAHQIAGKRPAQIARLGLVHVPEGRQIFARLTVRDNLSLGALAHIDSAAIDVRLDEVLEIFPRLAERLGQVAGTLSGGEQQMLAIGRGLMSRPRLLMLDEPSMGLSPILTRTIFKALQVVRQRMAVLVVEQNVRAALAFATRGYLLESGEIIASGTPEVLTDESIRAAYLGHG
jgi:branched-chain amino acid transport system ATP-binding protein